MQHELKFSSLGIEVPDPATRPRCVGDVNGLAPVESAASPGRSLPVAVQPG